MKKNRDKSEKKPKSDEDDVEARKARKKAKMDAMRAQWGGDDGEEGGANEQYLKLKEGKNTVRYVPNKDPEEPWFISFAVHWNVGPNGDQQHRCIEPGGPFGFDKKADKQRNYVARKCPSCKKYCKNKTKSREFEFGSKAGKDYWTKFVAPWRARHQFVAACVKPKSKEDADKIFVHNFGLQIGKPLISAFYDEDGGGDFTSRKRGRNIVIIKEQKSKKATDVGYTVQISPDRKPLENWDEIKTKLPDLKSFVPPELSPDAILAILNGESTNDEEDDNIPEPGQAKKKSKKGGKRRDDDDDDVDLDDVEGDDDDESGEERKLRLKRRERDEDEDVDVDAEEEDDEDDEDADRDVDDGPSQKSKKQRLKEKLAKKAGKSKKKKEEDDDDDDDNSDDDDDDEDD